MLKRKNAEQMNDAASASIATGAPSRLTNNPAIPGPPTCEAARLVVTRLIASTNSSGGTRSWKSGV